MGEYGCFRCLYKMGRNIFFSFRLLVMNKIYQAINQVVDRLINNGNKHEIAVLFESWMDTGKRHRPSLVCISLVMISCLDDAVIPVRLLSQRSTWICLSQKSIFAPVKPYRQKWKQLACICYELCKDTKRAMWKAFKEKEIQLEARGTRMLLF